MNNRFRPTTRNEIVMRLSPDEIVERHEAREQALLRWAMFWMLLGSILGCAGTLIVIALFGR